MPQFPPQPEGPYGGPPAARPPRRFLPYAVAAGALALAAAGFLLGHATATNGSQKLSAGSALAATTQAAATPTTSCTTNKRGVAGTLKSIDGASSLTVTSRSGATVKVTASSTTKIQKTVAAKVSDVVNGSVVTVRGTSSGTNAISADQISVLPASAGQKLTQIPPAAAGPARRGTQAGIALGTVSKVANGTFTVTEPGGNVVTVTTSASTKVIKTVDAAVKDLTPGQPIAVAGTANADGSVAATAITQGDPGLALGRGFGPGVVGPGPGGFGRFGGSRGPAGTTPSTTPGASPASSIN